VEASEHLLFAHPIHSPKLFSKDEKAHFDHAPRWHRHNSSKFPYLPCGGGAGQTHEN